MRTAEANRKYHEANKHISRARELARIAAMTPEELEARRVAINARRRKNAASIKATKEARLARKSPDELAKRAEAQRAYFAAYNIRNRELIRQKKLAREKALTSEQKSAKIKARIGATNYETVRVMPCRLYCVTHDKTGRTYIGITITPPALRWQRHCAAAKVTNTRIGAAILKYGKDAFTFQVLHTYANAYEAAEAEKTCIAFMGLTGSAGYNMSTGGGGARGLSRAKRNIECADLQVGGA